jgi:hypothetical protein
MRQLRKLGASLAAAAALFALGTAPTAQAQSTPVHVFPPQSRPYGHSYTQWEMRFFRFFAAIPASESPNNDHTGARCAVGQSGPVWYVPNTWVNADIHCAVPAGKALLVVPVFPECSTAEGNGHTYEALQSCVKGYVAALNEVVATVDGVHLTGLRAHYLFETPLFTYAYPKDFEFNPKVPGPGTTMSVADGVYLMLAPLPAGHYTVALSAHLGAPYNVGGTVTYHLTIGS